MPPLDKETLNPCLRQWEPERPVSSATVSWLRSREAPVPAAAPARYVHGQPMNCLTEVLGLGLPGNGTIPAVYGERIRLAKTAGMQVMKL